jgi:formylglycine-generating enzyme required for sulfatase activity
MRMQVRAQTVADRWARTLAIGAALFGMAPVASAVTIDWTPIGNPGNAGDPQDCYLCVPGTTFGSVPYTYSIGTYEVTNAQYAEFLNAKAATDPLALYSTSMGAGTGGITRSGSSGSFTYSAIAGRADTPVNYVSFYDTLRFTNWLNNGQGAGDTETGAYTLLGGTATPSNGTTVTRNAGATIFLSSEDEWYKAAYYNALSTSYFDYPAGSDTQTTCAFPPTTGSNTANCYDGDDYGIADVGSYTGSSSPYGTFDQGGNVWEWNDAIISGPNRAYRGLRGGAFNASASYLAASCRCSLGPEYELNDIGFRVASIPEPGTGSLLILGMLSLASWRRHCR